MRKFGDAVIEKSGKMGYRRRQKDEVDVLLIKDLIKELRDDALTVVTPSRDTAAAEQVEQRLNAARSSKPELW